MIFGGPVPARVVSRPTGNDLGRHDEAIKAQKGGFFGTVSSSKSKCGNGRKVTLYRVSGGKSKSAGSDIAQPNGNSNMWSINVSKSGKFYAKAKATSGCAAAKSKTISSQ